jgi:beta-glucanase (GH16 family)
MQVRDVSRAWLAAALSLAACGHRAHDVGAPPAVASTSVDSGRFKLVWADEFDTEGPPDERKWNFERRPPGWVNKELQNYTSRPENARVEGGKLIVEARRDSFAGFEYSSARLTSAQKGDLLYGRVEVRAKIPRGRGTWPAIWMMPTDNAYGRWPSSGEIDIMEHVGFDPGVVHASTHCRTYYWRNNNHKTATTSVPDFADAMHVYAVEWSAQRIDAFVDGTRYFTVQNEGTGWQAWPFDKRFHVILNLAIGGEWGGQKGVDTTIFPVRMEVDYVRLYEPVR